MAVRVNTHAFQQTIIQSAQLGVLGMIVHQMTEDANYSAIVVRGGIEISTFQLVVDTAHANTQVNVDLASLAKKPEECCEKDARDGIFKIGSKGYLILYVSEGVGGFHVLLSKLGEGGKPTLIFDSRVLAASDQFVATLLRPGAYALVDELGKGKGNITVEYPKIDNAPYRPGEPEKVVVLPDVFEPAEIALSAAQGIVFSVQTPRAALTISLIEADDGPVQIRPQVRWTNPRTGQE